jgi:hypothetical protein
MKEQKNYLFKLKQIDNKNVEDYPLHFCYIKPPLQFTKNQ